MIESFSHVTVSCTDIDRSVAFYKKIGLEVTLTPGELDSDGVAKAFALSRGHLTVVHLAPKDAEGGMVIDLVQWLDPNPAGSAYPSVDYLGLTRLAFRVTDIDATASSLREAGVDFLSDEVQSFGKGVRSIAFKDPDGTILQLIEGLDKMSS